MLLRVGADQVQARMALPPILEERQPVGRGGDVAPAFRKSPVALGHAEDGGIERGRAADVPRLQVHVVDGPGHRGAPSVVLTNRYRAGRPWQDPATLRRLPVGGTNAI